MSSSSLSSSSSELVTISSVETAMETEQRLKEYRHRRFIMDYSVNKIAKYFRLLGYDTICNRNISHDHLLRVAAREERIVITCSRALNRQVATHNAAVRRRKKKAAALLETSYMNNGGTNHSECINENYNTNSNIENNDNNNNIKSNLTTLHDAQLNKVNHSEETHRRVNAKINAANDKINETKNRVVVAYDSDGESIYSEVADDECIFMESEIECHYVNQWRNCEFQETMIDLIKRLRLKFNVDVVFSRCATCNTLLRPIAKTKVRKRVEAKVYNMFAGFTECSTCEKVYWGFEDGHVSNYKTYRTLDMLQSLCAAAETAIIAPLAPLCTLKSFTAFPRKVKINVFNFLTESDLDVLAEVFPLLKGVISEEKESRAIGVEVKHFRKAQKKSK